MSRNRKEELFVNLEDFNRLAKKFADVISNSAMKTRLRTRGLQSVREAKRRIDQSVDVRGNPFAPIKARRKPLFKTQSLYRAFGFKSNDTKLQIFNSVSYFSFHNFGTKFIARRQTLDEKLEQDSLFTFIKKEIDSVK